MGIALLWISINDLREVTLVVVKIQSGMYKVYNVGRTKIAKRVGI